jgi:transcriptional regulator with GAF, ATPase, and Fis domain
MVLVPVAQPLRRRLQDTVEELLFPDYRRASRAIHDASRELARLRGRAEVARHLRAAIQSSVRSARVRLVAGRPGGDLAELDPEPDQVPLEIPSGDRLQTLLSRGATVNLDQTGQTGSRVAKPIRDLLQRSNSRMLVPLPSSETLMGAFLLGARTDGRLYISDDEQLVETLAAQSSIAIENADAWEEVRRLQHRLENENVYLRRELELQHSFEEIVGAGVELKAALAQVEQVAPTDASVLVMGETGTGKELVVRAIHSLSGRRDRVLVKVACAAIPETLLESELFGHSRGAFTGASSSHRGRFDVADGGTIFFDDVDTLPLGIQAKLLRALQEGEIQRLGDTETRRVDVRVVASTNKDLLQEVREGRFREDLYYRLNVVPIQIPPLRARPGDIPLLVEYFLERESAKLGRQFRGIAEDTMTELCTYAWPGNVRELRNVIERAVVLCRDDVLRLPGPLAPVRPGEASPAGAGPGLAEKVRRYKIRLVTEALESADGNQRRAAEALGLHRPSLSRMIRDLGIRRPGEHPRRQVGRSRGEGRE